MPLLLERVLWFAGPLLQVAMGVVIVRRKLYREVPWFFAYIVFSASQSAVSFFVRHKMPLYFYYYWVAELVALIMGFIIIYEIFTNIVTRYEGIQRLGFMLYRWCAVLLLFFATITIASSSDLNSAVIFEAIITLQRGVRIMQVGLLALLFAFASYLGLSWRNCSFGVALGFGFLAVVELTLAAVRSHLGPDADQLYALLKPIAYCCTLVIWTVYMWRPEPATTTVTSLPAPEVAGWNQTLTEYLRR